MYFSSCMCLLICVYYQAIVISADNVEVTTRIGTFIGSTSQVTNFDGESKTMRKFLGIPYAEPPVGKLRFAKPVAKTVFKEPIITQEFGNQCIQYFHGMTVNNTDSEDCLFLNVYAPAVRAGEALPVMVWIHGGAFVSGSSNMYIADDIAVNGNVIVVTLNYRVSIFGFFSTADKASPGNYGLWDQRLAIKWVHNHIPEFGGDVERITIFGESAGSASVIYQGMYPSNKGLFKRIIAQSGSATSSWAQTFDARADAKTFAALLNCDSDSTIEIVNCLREADLDDIFQALNNPSGELSNQYPLPFLPTIDGEFIKYAPTDVADLELNVAQDVRDVFSSFDLLTGINSDEGPLYILVPFFGVEDPMHFLPNKTTFETTLTSKFLLGTVTKDPVALDILTKVVAAEYTDWDNSLDPLRIRQRYIEMIGDREFLSPLIQTLNLHSADTTPSATYMYYLDAAPRTHLLPTTPPWFHRTNHADDLKYLFNGKLNVKIPGFDLKFDPEGPVEEKLAYSFITMWTNFAKTGNPNTPRDLDIDWLQYSNKNKQYLDILPYSSEMRQNLKERVVHFWGKVVPTVLDTIESLKGTKTCEKYGNCNP